MGEGLESGGEGGKDFGSEVLERWEGGLFSVGWDGMLRRFS